MTRFTLLVLFAVSLIAGGVSLDRVFATAIDLGWLGELRTWLLVPLVAFVYLHFARGVSDFLIGRAFAYVALLFVALHLTVAVSFVWASNLSGARVVLADILFLIGAVFVGAVLALPDPQTLIDRLFRLFWVASVALLLVGFVLTGGVAGQVVSIGAGGIGTARLHGSATLASLYLWRTTGAAWWLVPVPLQLASMVLSGARAPGLALLCAVFLLSLRSMANRSRRLNSSLAFFAIVGCALIALGISGSLTLILDVLEQSLFVSRGGRTTIYLADRDVIFKDAWEQFLENPLGGVGLGNYVGPFGEAYPHNIVLSYIIDGGVAALLILLVIAGFAAWSLLTTVNPERYASLCMSLYFLICSLFAGSYYDARGAWVFLMASLVPVVRARVRVGTVLRKDQSSLPQDISSG